MEDEGVAVNMIIKMTEFFHTACKEYGGRKGGVNSQKRGVYTEYDLLVHLSIQAEMLSWPGVLSVCKQEIRGGQFH